MKILKHQYEILSIMENAGWCDSKHIFTIRRNQSADRDKPLVSTILKQLFNKYLIERRETFSKTIKPRHQYKISPLGKSQLVEIRYYENATKRENQ